MTDSSKPAGDLGEITCPSCEERISLKAYACSECGFPLVCDISPMDTPVRRGLRISWRVLLGIAVFIFWLTNSLLVHGSYNRYNGLTIEATGHLTPLSDSGVAIGGPAPFVFRTQMALALIERRAPAHFLRIQNHVTSIDFLAPSYLETPEGRRISLERIGALATPSSGKVQVLYNVAFPRGTGDLMDYDVFSYAGVLIHELRHIELHKFGQAPGGWQEEVLCEEAAYEMLKGIGAPGRILGRYELYLDDPLHSSYQHWYDWYEQWE